MEQMDRVSGGNVTAVNSPCRACADRRVGCHDACRAYQAFDRTRKEMRDKHLAAMAELQANLARKTAARRFVKKGRR